MDPGLALANLATPDLLDIDVPKLTRVIEICQKLTPNDEYKVDPARVGAATAKLTIARAAQAAATELSASMRLSYEVVEVDSLRLEKAIKIATDLVWRCEGLQPKVDEASARLERARMAQVANRVLDREVAPVDLTKVKTVSLSQAIEEAQSSYVPRFNVDSAIQKLHDATRAQQLVRDLEEIIDMEDLDIDIERLHDLIDESGPYNLRRDLLANAGEAYVSAKRAQAEVRLFRWAAPPLLKLDTSTRKYIDEAKEADVALEHLEMAEAKLIASIEAQAAAVELKEAMTPPALLDVDVEALSKAHERGKKATLPSDMLAAAALKLGLATSCQEALRMVEEAAAPEGLLDVDTAALEAALEAAVGASVPEERLVMARERLPMAVEAQEADAALDELTAATNLFLIDVNKVHLAAKRAKLAQVPEAHVKRALKKRDDALEARAALEDLKVAMEPELVDLDLELLKEKIDDARIAGCEEDDDAHIILIDAEDKYARAPAAKAALLAMQEAAFTLDLAIAPPLLDIDVAQLRSLIEAANACGVPPDRISIAEHRMHLAERAQKAAAILKEAMKHELLVGLDARMRRENLEKALHDARRDHVPVAEKGAILCKKAQAKLDRVVRARKAMNDCHTCMAYAFVDGQGNVVGAETVDGPELRAIVQECADAGWPEDTTWLIKAHRILVAVAELEEERRLELERMRLRAAEEAEKLAQLLKRTMEGHLATINVRRLRQVIEEVQERDALRAKLQHQLALAKQIAVEAEGVQLEYEYDVFISHALPDEANDTQGGGSGSGSGSGGGGAGGGGLGGDEHAQRVTMHRKHVKRIKTWLYEAGFLVKCDTSATSAGEMEHQMPVDYPAMDKARVVILCLSESYIRALAAPSKEGHPPNRCKREYTHALNTKGPDGLLIPITIETFKWGGWPDLSIPEPIRHKAFPYDPQAWYGPASGLRLLPGVWIDDFSSHFEDRMLSLLARLASSAVFPRLQIGSPSWAPQPWLPARVTNSSSLGVVAAEPDLRSEAASAVSVDKASHSGARIVLRLMVDLPREPLSKLDELRVKLVQRIRSELKRVQVHPLDWGCQVTTTHSGCRLDAIIDHRMSVHVVRGVTVPDDPDDDENDDDHESEPPRTPLQQGEVAQQQTPGEQQQQQPTRRASTSKPPPPPLALSARGMEDAVLLRDVVVRAWPTAERLTPRDMKFEWSDETASKKTVLHMRVDCRVALILEQLREKERGLLRSLQILRMERLPADGDEEEDERTKARRLAPSIYEQGRERKIISIQRGVQPPALLELYSEPPPPPQAARLPSARSSSRVSRASTSPRHLQQPHATAHAHALPDPLFHQQRAVPPNMAYSPPRRETPASQPRDAIASTTPTSAATGTSDPHLAGGIVTPDMAPQMPPWSMPKPRPPPTPDSVSITSGGSPLFSSPGGGGPPRGRDRRGANAPLNAMAAAPVPLSQPISPEALLLAKKRSPVTRLPVGAAGVGSPTKAAVVGMPLPALPNSSREAVAALLSPALPRKWASSGGAIYMSKSHSMPAFAGVPRGSPGKGGAMNTPSRSKLM